MGASVALYRKYRSKTFSDVLGQDHVTKALENAIKTGRISHAYLFTGPRGVGKTSVARLIAHEVNKLDYDETKNHLDIIEIDAASNRKIDEIRDLREKIHIAPVQAQYKVYIIDEVHMLTREAFNALLKTLEEPPAHAIFILATTEAHKVPSTIISRTQRHTFLPIAVPVIIQHLKDIAKKEGIKIDDEALTMLAEHGDGSFRDSISLLDLMAGTTDKKITAGDVQTMLGLPPKDALQAILQAAQAGDSQAVLQQYRQLLTQGANAATVSKQLVSLLRNQPPTTASNSFTRDLLDVLGSSHQEAQLEVVLLQQALTNQTSDSHSQPHIPAIVAAEPAVAEVTPEPAKIEAPAPREPDTPQPAAAPATKTDKNYSQLADDERTSFLQAIKKQNNSLYSVVRVAVIERHQDGTILRMRFRFPFHQKQTQQSKNAEQLHTAAKDSFPSVTTVECVVDTSLGAQEKVQPKTHTHAVLETFGGGEVIDI